jgi:hypothetical protein
MFEKCPFTKYEDVICVKGVLWQITNAGRLLWGACEQCAKVTGYEKDIGADQSHRA